MSDRPHPVLGVPAEEVTPGVWVALRRQGQQWLYWIDVGIGYAGAVRTPGRDKAATPGPPPRRAACPKGPTIRERVIARIRRA